MPQARVPQEIVDVDVEVGRRAYRDGAVGLDPEPALEELELIARVEGPIDLDGVDLAEVLQQWVHHLHVSGHHGIIHVHLGGLPLLWVDGSVQRRHLDHSLKALAFKVDVQVDKPFLGAVTLPRQNPAELPPLRAIAPHIRERGRTAKAQQCAAGGSQ